MLELKNISFSSEEKDIIKDISYKFEDETSYAVLGNNGVGKSTLSKIIMGLDGYINKHKGNLIFNSKDITYLPINERANLGVTIAWQEPARFEGITVRDYLCLGGKFPLKTEEIKKYLKMVGLNESYISRKVDKTLSGGERKRIELASIVILKPKLVVLDEPDSGIDMMSNFMIKNVIENLKKNGATVIVITHREVVAKLTDKALLLCGGIIRNEGSPERVSKIYKEICDNCNHINKPFQSNEVKA